MNERIHELIKEATEFQKIPYDGIDGVYREAFVFNKEKFARLIVKECSTICLNENVSNIDLNIIHQSGKFTVQDLATKSCGENLAKRIKEHFGVE